MKSSCHFLKTSIKMFIRGLKMIKRAMQEIVAEYNSLTGQNVKRFATAEIGEKRLALAKGSKPVPVLKTKPIPKWKMAGITVDGCPYRSIKEAFDKLGLPLNKHGKLRLRLKASGKEIFEHNGKQYHFGLIEQGKLL